MKKNANQFNIIKLTVWIILVFVLTIFGFLIYLYNFIEKDRSDGFAETETYIYDNTEIATIEAISSFQAEELFHIITGEDSKNEKYIVFLPLENKENLTMIPFNETISEKEIVSNWNKTCDKCKSIIINYAMIEEQPLWELTYMDGSNRYVFDYFSLYDGEQFEQLRLYRKFR